MDFNLDSTQQMLLDNAERLAASRGSVEFWRARRDEMEGFDETLWRAFADLGWLALPIPEQAGGLGGSMTDVALLMIVFGRHNVIEPYVGTAILGTTILQRGDGEEVKAVLTAAGTGHARLALAHGEAADRYEITARRKTTATPTDRGFRVSGRKLLAVDAPSATHLLVTATLEPGGETLLFLLPSDAQGLVSCSYPLVDGSRAADIVLHDVDLPSEAVIARGAAAAALLREAIDNAIVAQLAQAVGSMEACVDLCSEYVKERKQFGRPIGEFQALQHLLVDMLVAHHQSRSALYAAIAALDEADDVRSRRVSLAKVLIGSAMQHVSRTGIQLHGGYGLTDEYAISHHFRRLLVLEKSFGDIAHHLHAASGGATGE